MTFGRRGWLANALAACAALAIGLAACGGSTAKRSVAGGGVVPSRASTVGDRVLRYLPAGADLLIEVDLARVRGNAVVGGVVTAWLRLAVDAGAADESSGSPGSPGSNDAVDAVTDLARAPLLTADAIVLAAYGVGTQDAATATLVIGGEVPGALAIAEGVALLAPPPLARRAEAATAGAETSLVADKTLLELRTRAMPEAAEGASVRVTGRLGFDARVALASATGAEAAPRELSVWADVVDDAALIAVLEGDDGKGEQGGARLQAMVQRVIDRLAEVDEVRALGLGPPLRRTALERSGDRVRLVTVVGPKRLRRAMERLGTVSPSPTPTPTPSPSPTPSRVPAAAAAPVPTQESQP